jgi:hypothetical protein
MTKTCLRCDWEGETVDAWCPNCGVALYVPGALRPEGAGIRAGDAPNEPSRDTPSMVGTASSSSVPRSAPPLPASEDDGSASRSSRWVVAFTLATLVLIVALGARLKADEERSAPTTPTAMAAPITPTTTAAPITPPTAHQFQAPSTGLPEKRVNIVPGRYAIESDGARFSVKIPDGWQNSGNIYLSKNTDDSQGAEAMVLLTSLVDGDHAEPCGQWWGEPDGGSVGFATSASRAHGTELVTGPTQVTLGGRHAMYVVLTVRRNRGCNPGFFYTWQGWQDCACGAFWAGTEVGDTIRIWIVDVGRTLVIEADTHGNAGRDLEHQVQQIVGSIDFR